MSTEQFWGIYPWVLLWGVPLFSGGELSTKKSFELILEICHLQIQLKIVLELILT